VLFFRPVVLRAVVFFVFLRAPVLLRAVVFFRPVLFRAVVFFRPVLFRAVVFLRPVVFFVVLRPVVLRAVVFFRPPPLRVVFLGPPPLVPLDAGIGAGGGRVIAVGQAGSAPAQSDPSIWTRTVFAQVGWQQRCPNEPRGLCPGAQPRGLGVLYDVVARPPGGRRSSWTYLAVGAVTQPRAHKFDDAAVWRSSDGLRWQAVGDPSFAGSHSQIIKAAAVTARGTVVAVGRDGVQGATWYSADERSWQTADAAAFDVPGGSAELNDVVFWHSALIAVGRRTIDKRPQAAVWISKDQGQTWARINSPSFRVHDQRGAVMTGIAGGASRLVAVGYAHTGTQAVAASWSSANGREWQRVESPSFKGHGSREMNAVLAVDDTFYGAGDASTAGGTRKAQVWTGRKHK
jgi:hypothetical protein